MVFAMAFEKGTHLKRPDPTSILRGSLSLCVYSGAVRGGLTLANPPTWPLSACAPFISGQQDADRYTLVTQVTETEKDFVF